MNWTSHINNICASSFRKLGFLRYKLKTAPSHVKLLAYNTLIRPKLEYGCMAWDPYLKKDVNKLEMVQRKAVRFIFNAYRRIDSPSALMAANNISTLENRRLFARLRFLYLIYNHQLGIDSRFFILPRVGRQTRHSHLHCLEPFFARTNCFKNSFFPRTILKWNALPIDVFSTDDVTTFEERVRIALCWFSALLFAVLPFTFFSPCIMCSNEFLFIPSVTCFLVVLNCCSFWPVLPSCLVFNDCSMF